jgi:hypothetical protein
MRQGGTVAQALQVELGGAHHAADLGGVMLAAAPPWRRSARWRTSTNTSVSPSRMTRSISPLAAEIGFDQDQAVALQVAQRGLLPIRGPAPASRDRRVGHIQPHCPAPLRNAVAVDGGRFPCAAAGGPERRSAYRQAAGDAVELEAARPDAGRFRARPEGVDAERVQAAACRATGRRPPGADRPSPAGGRRTSQGRSTRRTPSSSGTPMPGARPGLTEPPCHRSAAGAAGRAAHLAQLDHVEAANSSRAVDSRRVAARTAHGST